MRRSLTMLLVLLLGIPLCGAPAVYAGGDSQLTVPKLVSLDVKPAHYRCAGPVQPNPPLHVERCSGRNGALYLATIKNRSSERTDGGKWQMWRITMTVEPPTPGISVEDGCNTELNGPHQCDDLEPAFNPLPLARNGDWRWPFTVKVEPGAPFGREVRIKVCLTRLITGTDGGVTATAAPVCILPGRRFTSAGGTARPK